LKSIIVEKTMRAYYQRVLIDYLSLRGSWVNLGLF
jgi:hypothetical protein